MKKILIAIGIVVTLTAVFAPQLGIDNDAGWGGRRLYLLALGVILTIAGMSIHFFGGKFTSFISRANASIDNMASRPARILGVSITVTILVFIFYFWFIRLDERAAWAEYEYYVGLAKSFKMGQLQLEVKPPPELLALENPYDYFLRRELNVDNFPWDVSLYKDNFYVYWGPAPAALLTIFSREQLDKIGDFHLALVFTCGLFIYMALIITSFWRRSLHYAPAWLLGILLLVVGLATPVTIMLKGAKIYEAAIFSCQFFLFGGFYWAYSAMQEENLSIWKLALAAIHWVFSIGSRVIVLPAVIFCVGFLLIYAFKIFNKNNFKAFTPIFLAIIMPLVIGGIGLAWYNWARFDSIFEFGLKYQLANIDYTNFQNIFAISRIPQNIHLYFAFPIKVLSRFPYLMRIEYLNSNDRLAGLIYIAPYFFLLAFPLLRFFKSLLPFQKIPAFDAQADPSEKWLFHTLLGSGITSLFIILSYYFIAMRFIEDFMPALITVITIQVGREYDLLHGKTALQRVFITVVVILALITISSNVLLAIPSTGINFAVNLLNSISKLLGLR